MSFLSLCVICWLIQFKFLFGFFGFRWQWTGFKCSRHRPCHFLHTTRPCVRVPSCMSRANVMQSLCVTCPKISLKSIFTPTPSPPKIQGMNAHSYPRIFLVSFLMIYWFAKREAYNKNGFEMIMHNMKLMFLKSKLPSFVQVLLRMTCLLHFFVILYCSLKFAIIQQNVVHVAIICDHWI